MIAVTLQCLCLFLFFSSEKSQSATDLLHSTGANEIAHSHEVLGTAVYDFNGEGDSELTFVAGDLVAVDGTVEGADDWSWGVLHGKRGMFPTVFVEL